MYVGNESTTDARNTPNAMLAYPISAKRFGYGRFILPFVHDKARTPPSNNSHHLDAGRKNDFAGVPVRSRHIANEAIARAVVANNLNLCSLNNLLKTRKMMG
jgi:hypothetical protein